MIHIISSSRYQVNRRSIKEVVASVLADKNITLSRPINIVFMGKNKMKEIAAKYKQENVALPVLSFIYNIEEGGEKLLGEILICYPQAVLMAAQKGKKVDDTIASLVRHGMENIAKNI